MIAYAAAADVAQTFLIKLNDVIIYPLITFLMAVALLVFLYGCFEFIMHAGDPGDRSHGKQHILWGIIGFVVMVSAYAILSVAVGTIGCDLNNIDGCK